MVLQNTEPWLSQHISKGADWLRELRDGLDSSIAGIVCLTPGTLQKEWVLFELGALSKHVDEALVCTYLVGVAKSDMKPPLSIFMATDSSSKDDTRELVRTLNAALGERSVEGPALDSLFDLAWPKLEQDLAGLPAEQAQTAKRTTDELLQEVLLTVRRIESRSARPLAQAAAPDSPSAARDAVNPADTTTAIERMARRYWADRNALKNAADSFDSRLPPDLLDELATKLAAMKK